jgi:cytochrome c biogenesis protein CcdA
MPSPSFGQFFLLGLLGALAWWTCVVVVVVLFALVVLAGPILALVVVVLGLVALGLCVVALANGTQAGRRAKAASIERQRGL